jgi:hypothetical protein
MAISPGNFRRAEEASNAEGTTKGALDFALKNAKANPTKANLAILADTNAARQQTLVAQGKSPAQIAAQVKTIVDGIPAQTAELDKIIKEANDAIVAAQTAAKEASAAGGFNFPTGKKDLILAALKELNIPSSMQQASLAFIENAMVDGFTQEQAIQLYYNNKNFTTKAGETIESPFYKEFTYLRDFAPKNGQELPTPKELMAFKLGVKDLVAKTGRSSLFASEESIQKFISNGVKITDLDTRFAEYATASLAADPNKVATLKKLGYINDSQGLIDFYADSSIGQKQFEINQKTAAFAQQALQRVSSGITFDAEKMKKLAAASGSTNAGIDVGTVEANASKAFQTIGETLLPTAKVSGFYERNAFAKEAERVDTIQSELESEQFMGMPSERRKRLLEQNARAFQGTAGTTTGSFKTTGMI